MQCGDFAPQQRERHGNCSKVKLEAIGVMKEGNFTVAEEMTESLLNVLRCPACKKRLEISDTSLICTDCKVHYDASCGRVDLRLREPKSVCITHQVGATDETHRFEPPLSLPHRQILDREKLAGIRLPRHVTKEIANWLTLAKREGARVLDLGCGNGEYRELLEHLGFEWVGIDIGSSTGVIADAHALPFESNSFDLVISLSALEHLEYPIVALQEVARVMKHEGHFIGSSAYLVPFHGTASYCNFTHLGLCSAFRAAGLRIDEVVPSATYLGTNAIAFSGLFLGMPRFLAYLVVAPINLCFHVWWFLISTLFPKRFNRVVKYAINTGAFSFSAHRDTS